MKKIVQKSSITKLNIAALLFVSFLLAPHCEALAQSEVSRFSRMSRTVQESYGENLLNSPEYRSLTIKLFQFIPISSIGLEDWARQNITTEDELMAWIDNNLPHTKFRSITEARVTYREIEQLRRSILQKFPDIDFSERSSDIAFLSNHAEQRERRARISISRSYSGSRQLFFDGERICSAIHLLFTPDITLAIANMVACETNRRHDRIREIRRQREIEARQQNTN